jgi:uncharacterized protein (TIGR02271 family)
VKTGSIRVDKHVDKKVRKIAAPLLHDDVEVKRVAVNRVIQKVPAVRTKDGVVIVPVVEEELVITKQLVLKEEIHLIRQTTKQRTVKEVEVEKERAEVRRLDSNGKVIDDEPENPTPGRGRRWRSVLD